jgi:hypothetical protein
MSDVKTKRKVVDFPEMVGEAQEMVTDSDIEAEIEAKHPMPLPEVELPVKEEEKSKALNLNDLTVADIRYLLEQKLLKEAEDAAAIQEKIKAPSKPPKGMCWVFNRGPQKWEWQYDGVIYELEGHEMGLFPERIARHARKRSIVSLDAFSNKAVFRVALEGEEKFGVPLKAVSRTELIDRSVNDNPLGKGPGRTHPAVLNVAGVAELLSRRQDKYIELE